LLHGVVEGAVGTAAMSASEWLHVRAHRRWLPDVPGPIDYDISSHVVTAAARVLRVRPRTPAQRQVLFLVTHVGYGSAFGVVGDLLASTALSPRVQVLVFASITEAFACTAFPLLGDTPPPWRWPVEALLASVVQHLVYAGGAVATGHVLHLRAGTTRT
jgi:hypothetical protein